MNMAKQSGYKFVVSFKGIFRGVRRSRTDATKYADKLVASGKSTWDRASVYESQKGGSPKLIYETTVAHHRGMMAIRGKK